MIYVLYELQKITTKMRMCFIKRTQKKKTPENTVYTLQRKTQAHVLI